MELYNEWLYNTDYVHINCAIHNGICLKFVICDIFKNPSLPVTFKFKVLLWDGRLTHIN